MFYFKKKRGRDLIKKMFEEMPACAGYSPEKMPKQ